MFRLFKLAKAFEKKVAQMADLDNPFSDAIPKVDPKMSMQEALNRVQYDKIQDQNDIEEAAFNAFILTMDPEKRDGFATLMETNRDTATKYLAQIMQQIKQKKQEYDAENTLGDKDLAAYQKMQQQQIQRARDAKIVNDEYLQRLNLYTTRQIEIQGLLRRASSNTVKGRVNVSVIVNPDFSVNYQVSSQGQGMTPDLNYKMTRALNYYTPMLVGELKRRMQRDNMRIEAPIKAVMFDGGI